MLTIFNMFVFAPVVLGAIVFVVAQWRSEKSCKASDRALMLAWRAAALDRSWSTRDAATVRARRLALPVPSVRQRRIYLRPAPTVTSEAATVVDSRPVPVVALRSMVVS